MIFDHRWNYALLMFAFMAIVVLITVWLRRAALATTCSRCARTRMRPGAAGIDVPRSSCAGWRSARRFGDRRRLCSRCMCETIDPPTLFSLTDVGFKFALLALIGGIGTISGPVLGAFLIIPVENWLRAELGGGLPGMHLAILGGRCCWRPFHAARVDRRRSRRPSRAGAGGARGGS